MYWVNLSSESIFFYVPCVTNCEWRYRLAIGHNVCLVVSSLGVNPSPFQRYAQNPNMTIPIPSLLTPGTITIANKGAALLAVVPAAFSIAVSNLPLRRAYRPQGTKSTQAALGR